MNIGEIIGEALDYPGSNLKKVIGLGVLIIISFLIIPIFLVYGYNLRVLKATIAGFDELPDFDEWGDMFIDGLKVFVVGIVYMIIPLIVMFTAIYLINSNLTTGLIIAVIGVILTIIFGLIEQVAIAHMAFNDSLGAAFQIGEILNIISEIGWLKYIIWVIGVAIVFLGTLNLALFMVYIILIPVILTLGISAITQIISGAIATAGFIIILIILALLLFLFVIPYLQLFYYRALGRLYTNK